MEEKNCIEYKHLCKLGKNAVSKAKFKSYNELYERLRIQKRVKEMYKLVQVKEKRARDF